MEPQLEIPADQNVAETRSTGPVETGNKAAAQMAEDLKIEHRRWNLPLLTWEDDKVVAHPIFTQQASQGLKPESFSLERGEQN
jgi:hypothetical protein